MTQYYSYLALGDSYTIGEGVPLHQSYPYQAVQFLRTSGEYFHAPEIVAKSGWTTSELSFQIDHTILNTSYDFVSLLIGVNNQYRGMSPSRYAQEFEELLAKSLSWTGEKPERIFVLSIPDWSRTPFAIGRDVLKISEEVAYFNQIIQSISKKHNTSFINITDGSPETAEDPSYLTEDGLHPSGKAYQRWASLLAEGMKKVI